MSQVGELYQDLSADIRVPQLAAFLRTILRPGLVVPAHSISLRWQEKVGQVPAAFPVLASSTVFRSAPIETEVRRIGLALQDRLLSHASRLLTAGHYLVTAEAPSGRIIGSMEFLLERAVKGI